MSDSDAILQAIRSLQAMLEAHIGEETRQIERFMAGFPDGDPLAHRSAHETWIEESVARKEFWKKMKFELAKWGLFGFLGWAVYQLWAGFLKGPH